jgi:2-keto-4-pentenoate hydratase/2-oxohepta-3-ene-1,7-dioic acid hydratase in catechol pathway
MKFASYLRNGVPSWGIVQDQIVFDVGSAVGNSHPSLLHAIASEALGEAARGKRADRLELASLKFLPVIVNPTKILCVGLNYDDHRRETGRPESKYPTIFTRYADSLIAHGADIVRPHVSTSLDFEGELAVVIGRGGRYIPAKDAMRHVAGYTCHNDATLRDWQRHTTQFTPGKTFPGTGPLGPYLVTADELLDLDKQTLVTRLNDVIVQSASIGDMIFSIPVLIEYLSAFTPLSPGDIIATGTPGGVGFKREPPLFMKPGDRVEVEISGVGRLVNGVVDER